MKNRKTIILVIVTIALMLLPELAFATDLDVPDRDGVDIEEYQYTKNLSTTLSISSKGVAKAKVYATGVMGVTTKISVTYKLQKKKDGKWSSVKTWKSSTNSLTLLEDNTKTVSSGTYRVHAVYEVYSGSSSETIIDNSKTKKY